MNIGTLGSTKNPAIEKLSQGTSLGVDKGNDGDFAQKLMDVLKEVNGSQQDAAQLNNDFTTGRRPVEIHDLNIAMERASIAMNLTMAVRNKILDAYQEINRMQV